MKFNGLYTDFYELTMAAALLENDKHMQPASFDYFYRSAPWKSAGTVFAGMETLAALLKDFNFGPDELSFLRDNGFSDRFLEWLGSTKLTLEFEFPPEGTIVFPNEPIVQISGPLSHCMLAEAVVLNILNFESLIATKAFRMRNELLPEQKLIDFGLRRSQGLAGLHASRAAIIGGCHSSSNVLSAKVHGHHTGGTHAHAWIQSFPSELEAFMAYAKAFPENCILLIDTYDTLKTGLPNAIKTAKELEKSGHRLKGIRLDSGDFTTLIPKNRKKLDEADLGYVKIVVSDNIDEFKIRDLNKLTSTADVFGVGTRLISAHGNSALNGVYKMSSLGGKAVIKRSDDPSKITLPGQKTIYRKMQGDVFTEDIITKADEAPPGGGYTALRTQKWKTSQKYQTETLELISQRVREQKSKLAPSLFRLEQVGEYNVSISDKLKGLRDQMLKVL